MLFIIYSICSIFVIWKEQKEAGFGPFLKMKKNLDFCFPRSYHELVLEPSDEGRLHVRIDVGDGVAGQRAVVGMNFAWTK